MKRYSILQVLGMLLVPGSLFLASCDDDNDEPDAELPAAYVAPNGTLSVGWDQADAAVNFTAPGKWTASSNASWVKISNEGGQFGERQLLISFEPNTYIGPRTATVMLVQGENKSEIKVTQAGCSDLAAVSGVNAEHKVKGVAGDGANLDLSGAVASMAINNLVAADVAAFTSGVAPEGAIELSLVDADGLWTPFNKQGVGGLRNSAAFDLKGNMVSKTAEMSYPQNAFYIDAQADGSLRVTRCAALPEDCEANVKIAFGTPDKFVILALHIAFPAPPSSELTIKDEEPEGNLKVSQFIDLMSEGFGGFTESDWADMIGKGREGTIKLFMLDKSGLEVTADYTANGLGYWIDKDYKPHTWTGAYPDNLLFIECREAGIFIGRAGDVPPGDYVVSFVLKDSENDARKCVFNITCHFDAASPNINIVEGSNTATVKCGVNGETPATLEYEAIKAAITNGLGLDEAAWKAALDAPADGAVVLDMLDAEDKVVDDNGARYDYTANAPGYWLDGNYKPCGWSGDGYPANTLYVEHTVDGDPAKATGGINIGCTGNLPGGTYELSFQFALRADATKTAVFKVTVYVP